MVLVGTGYTLRRYRVNSAGAWVSPADGSDFVAAFGGMRGGCEVEFARKPLAVTLRGAARRALRTRVATRFTDEQVAFLTQCFTSAIRVRDKEAWRRMREDVRFKNRLHPTTGRSLVLTQAQIAGWFSRKCGEEKKAARANALAAATALALEAEDDDDDDDDTPEDGDD